jgi:lincosamide nucleotidyltransferase A/C/D/E
VRAKNVVELLGRLANLGIDVWVGGGWGVDALLGRETRPHDDLDVSIRAHDEAVVLDLLQSSGFEVVTDWRPVRVALRHPTIGEIDVHPLHFEPDGSAWLPDLDGGRFDFPVGGFTSGKILGRRVPCITARLQLQFHLGYPPTATDRADMEALAAGGLIALPDEYRA